MANKHGSFTKENTSGPIVVQEVGSSVAVMIGIAPMGDIQNPVLLKSPSGAAQFGRMVPGFTLPQGLNDHFAEGGGTVIAINVFNAALHTLQVTDEALTLVDGKAKTLNPPVANTSVTLASGGGALLPNIDYSIDEIGNIKSLKNSTLAYNAAIKVTYKKLDPTTITSSLIIGTIDATTKVRTGMKLIEKIPALFKLIPKVITAPGHSTLSAVVTEMIYWVDRFKARGLFDMPKGTTLSVAITGRGPLGVINGLVSHERMDILFPWLQAYNSLTDTYEARPASAFISGLIARNDRDNDIHYSYSNKKLNSVTGLDAEYTGSRTDDGTDAQTLNDQGIVTVIQEGAEFYTWGNRSTAYPGSNSISTFHAVRRVMDIAAQSMQLALASYVDMPILGATRDAVLETANAYIRTLITRGAFVDAIAFFDPAKNPASQLAQGKFVLSLRACPPPPAEDIESEWYLDIEMLNKLTSNA